MALVHLNGLSAKLKAVTHVGRLLTLTDELFILWVCITLAVGYKTVLKSAHPARDLGQYTLSLRIAYLLITRSHSSHYLLIFLPFLSTYMALCASDKSFGRLPTFRRMSLKAAIGLYLNTGLCRIGYLLWLSYTLPDVTRLNAHMASLIGQRGNRVIAPIDFFYEQADFYTIHSVDYFALINGFPNHREKLTTAVLIEAAQMENTVALITYEGTQSPPARSPLRVDRYYRVYQNRWNSPYVRR